MSWFISAFGTKEAVRKHVAAATCNCNPIETAHFEAAKKAIDETIAQIPVTLNAAKVEANGSEYPGGMSQRIEVIGQNLIV